MIVRLGATLPAMRAVAALASVALAASAHAAPLGQAKLDVDADGKPEDVVLEADGSLRVGGVKRATLARVTGRAAFEAARTSTGTWLVVEAGEQAFVVNTRTWQVVATSELGGVGLDREYSIAVDALPEGVFRYQTRHDVRRCDGKPAYLFAERLDAPKGAPAAPPIAIGAAQQLTANVDANAAAPGGAVAAPLVYHARAASHQPGAPHAGALAIPRELDDGSLASVWLEKLPNAGEGQFFTFTPRVEGARARTIRIVPGWPRSTQVMRSHNRPRGLAIVTANDAWRVELPDAADKPLGTAFVIELPRPIEGCVTVILESVHGRPQGGTTAIAELEVYAEGERDGGGEALLARIVATGKGGDTAAAAALARRGASAATALEAELAKTTDAGARRRLVNALAKIPDPAVVPALVRAAQNGWVKDKDLVDVIAALGRNGQVQALRELAAKGPRTIRIAAIAQLKPVAGGFDALVELAGKGPREVRRAVIERLALAPGAQLAQSAEAQSNPAVAGDLWRALTRRARSHADERAAAVTAMRAALASATDYERRYRLIDGIASYGEPEALRELERLLASLPTAPQSSALRQVAVRAIASMPRGEAAPIVIALARDADPGVRLAALGALAGAATDTANAWHAAEGPDAIDRVIVTALTTDTWPEVRRRAAAALGSRCMRPGPAQALAEAVTKDADVDVRGDALTALVQCKAPAASTLLAKVWNDTKAPLELRTRAVSLVNMLGDRSVCASLVGKFRGWRGEALTGEGALKLAQEAAVAIGQCNAPGAAAALIEALDDSTFPEIQASAALGLAALGPQCPAAAKAKLTNLCRNDSRARRAACHAASRCGR